ncbi:MAG: polysaccharide pyruvyl transferase family protein [Cryobacterium sp.]
MLLIGAYERDNFGDLLFYELTRQYLTDHRVIAGSVIGADMTALLGERVLPYNDLLAARRWDAVWVVGGEIGGVDTGNALTMSLNDHDGEIFDAAGPRARDIIARYLADSTTTAPAYIPELDRFALNGSTPLIINSVGLGTMRPQGSSAGADAAIAALHRSNSLVVRDTLSQQFADTHEIPAILSPDMVHAISLRYPELADSDESKTPPYFLFQANGYIINKNGPEQIAQALAGVAKATGWRPVLFLAGTARHHDRPDQYDAVLDALRAISPGVHPTVLSTRSPLELSKWIAQSELWIGSSLHGRIIAGSFGRPRVSLENAKVSTYSATWDPEFPVNVEFSDLAAAAEAAIVSATVPSNRSAAHELAQTADAMTRQLILEHL